MNHNGNIKEVQEQSNYTHVCLFPLGCKYIQIIVVCVHV